MKKNMAKILFFPMGNINTPSTRVRCYAFAKELEKLENKTTTCGLTTLSRLPNNLLKLVQCALLLPFYDILYFNKSAHPTTYMLLKLAKFLGKKVILDVDDAEFLNSIWFEKFFKESDLVVAGSHFVLEHGKKANPNAVIIPTSVNPDDYPKKQSYITKDKIIIGWIGTSGNTKYLSIVKKSLKKVSKKYNIELRIITDFNEKTYDEFEGIDVNKIQWNVHTASSELKNFDLGIMPLFDTDWERGKCSFKAIEYMASGVPVVLSGIGENNYVVKDGETGFIANTEEDWTEKIELLIKSESLRKTFAKNGLKTIEENYNIKKQSEKLNELIQKLFNNY